MIHELLFGNSGGFGEGKRQNEHYYSQGLQRSQFGMSTGYGITAVRTSDDISGLAEVKYFAEKAGKLYAQDANGKVYRETNNGTLDFGSAHYSPTVASSGRGMIRDQKDRLLAFANTTVSKFESAWLESWQTGLTDADHFPDLFEDKVIFANGNKVGAINADDSITLDAFELPSSFTVVVAKAGSNGVLVGANLGYSGYLMLWDPNFADRAKAPWIPLSGTVQSIERATDGWIVVTQKEVLWTNGYSTHHLAPLFDDPLGYTAFTVYPQGLLRVNEKLFILNAASGYQRMKPGVLVFDLSTRLFDFIPLSTLNTASATPRAIYATKSTTQTVAVAFADSATGKNYIGSLGVTTGNRAMLISEPVGNGVSEKVSEAVILNITPSPTLRGKGTFSFDASVKIADLQRPIWGIHITNADSASAITLRVDGTSSSFFKAEVGDEVTILEGPNAGQVRHIASIANTGLSNETWTLDAALSAITVAGTDIQVEPYKLLTKKSLTNLTEVPPLFFPDKQKHRGKLFLIKILLENITNVQFDLHPSKFVYDDLKDAS
jgi:hypothetical protein